MSRHAPYLSEQGQLLLPCRSCGAEPGQWCRSSTGRPATYLHDSRYVDWWAICGPSLEEQWERNHDLWQQLVEARLKLREAGLEAS